MSADDNLKVVEGIYEAFGRADAAAILEQLTDDVDWATEAAGRDAPWWGVRKGKAEVGQFFVDFGSAMDVSEFNPISFAANATEVHTVVRLTATARATGKQASMDLHHLFRFRDGKVAFYRGAEDTQAVAETLRT